ncbi:hypothetical protein CNY89_24625, partial [Amaricoccus sp. HAR-UPW-R2A-40]
MREVERGIGVGLAGIADDELHALGQPDVGQQPRDVRRRDLLGRVVPGPEPRRPGGKVVAVMVVDREFHVAANIEPRGAVLRREALVGVE